MIDLRIAIIAFSGIFPIHIGGPGNVAYFLAKEFGEMGHRITLFARAMTDNEIRAFDEMQEFTQLHNVNVVPIRASYNARTLLNPLLVAKKIIDTSVKFRQQDFDAVLYNSPPTDIALLVPLISKLNKTKQVIVFHGLFHSLGLLNRYAIGRFLIRIYGNLFDAVIAPGELPRGDFLPCGFRRNRVTVIPNGIPLEDVERASPIDLDGYPRIIHAGVLTKRKGIDTLLRAIPMLVEVFPNLRLYLVGNGPERKELEKLAQSLHIEDSVDFVGFVKDTREVFRFYKSCHVFVMPSHKESFGITLTEAMACRIPVIATDIDGAPRMLIKNGVNGFLFPVGDWRTLSMQLRELLQNKETRERFAATNHRMVREQLTWETIASAYMSIITSL